jgi:hypothetical protein
MRVPRRVVVLSAALALLGMSFVLAPAAHADCLMIGHADLGAAPGGAAVRRPSRHTTVKNDASPSKRPRQPPEGRR